MLYSNSIVWLRHDLRLNDHTALKKACAESENVFLVFVFDEKILKKLDSDDQRVGFIWNSLQEIQSDLSKLGKKHSLLIQYGQPESIVPDLAKVIKAECVYISEDYEPSAIGRDLQVHQALQKCGSKLQALKNTVIFHKNEILKDNGDPYKVFTPYKRKWLETLDTSHLRAYQAELEHIQSWQKTKIKSITRLEEIGFKENIPAFKGGEKEAHRLLKSFLNKIDNYNNHRDYPSLDATSHLSIHLRFGTISIRELIRKTYLRGGEGAETWISELIWREFYKMILYKFPQVIEKSFNPKYADIVWPNKLEYFTAWKDGMTGVPIIDAAMRHFKNTGLMHNRLRMVVAQFLTKDLLVHWSYGEKYFEEKLIDFDLSANNGGWQWSASTGCDAQPYFRIFNPYLQSKRFDKDGVFIKEHIPELRDVDPKYLHDYNAFEKVRPKNYPKAIVNHKIMREKAIQLFKA